MGVVLGSFVARHRRSLYQPVRPCARPVRRGEVADLGARPHLKLPLSHAYSRSMAAPRPMVAAGSSKKVPMFEAVSKTPAMSNHFNFTGKICCRLAADGDGGNLPLN